MDACLFVCISHRCQLAKFAVRVPPSAHYTSLNPVGGLSMMSILNGIQISFSFFNLCAYIYLAHCACWMGAMSLWVTVNMLPTHWWSFGQRWHAGIPTVLARSTPISPSSIAVTASTVSHYQQNPLPHFLEINKMRLNYTFLLETFIVLASELRTVWLCGCKTISSICNLKSNSNSPVDNYANNIHFIPMNCMVINDEVISE